MVDTAMLPRSPQPGDLSASRYLQHVWLFALAITLHNLEEYIWLPAWSQSLDLPIPKIGTFPFRFAVVILTLAVYALIGVAARSRKQSPVWQALAGGMLVMGLNIFVPHTAATLAVGRYMPGLATAWLFIAPVGGYLMLRGVREGWMTWCGSLSWALGLLAGVPPLLLGLFWIGDRIHP